MRNHVHYTNHRKSNDGADLSNVILHNNRYIPVVKQFTYLGSIITPDETDTKDVEARVKKSSSTFGALKRSIFSSTAIDNTVKERSINLFLILPILLYGSECWCLTEQRLCVIRVFHRRCVKMIYGVTKSQAWKRGKYTAGLLQQIFVDPIELYLC